MIADAESILKICGVGSYLNIGCGNSNLVFELLKRSLDAYGLDSSPELVQKLNARAPGRFFAGSLSNFPFNVNSFDTIIVGGALLEFKPNTLMAIMTALQQLTKRNLVLYFSPEDIRRVNTRSAEGNRIFWEKCAIAGGFRRHPRGMLVNNYQEHEDERLGRFVFFERVPSAAYTKFSLEWLLANRDLHMDMLREAGRCSDAHLSRYFLAATKVRPGDVVLDAACGLGYGTAILAACSPGARFIGVDIDPDSIEYADANFKVNHDSISFKTCDVTKLAFLPDHSVDTVISFETIEHVPDYDLFLKEVRRVLKPDGRFLGSVPNMWCDETGEDPNPYHFHVFDWAKLKVAVGKYFIVEQRWAQVAGGGFRLRDGKRVMDSIPLESQAPVDPEWWIISACASPVDATAVTYTNPFKSEFFKELPAHIDFAKYYDNPWVYRVMVQLGERITDRNVLTSFCGKVARDARPGSADQGAALCVIGYQLLETGQASIADVSVLIELINAFEKNYTKQNIHAYRWCISLHYIGARLLLAIGQREQALQAFNACANMDALHFCPLLATKTISACMYAGLLYLGSNNIDDARKQFIRGVQESHRVLQGDWKNIVGNLDCPLPFGLQEAAEVIEIASQCAQALHALDKQTVAPGFFWERINLKRFGLVEWNKNLERENEELRRIIFQIQQERVA